MPWRRLNTGPKHRYRAVLFGFGCALFVYLLIRLGAAQITSLLLGIGWYLGLIAAIYAGHQLIRAFAYWKCVAASGRSSYWEIVRIRLSGEAIQFLTSTGPFLSEPSKVWLLQRQGLGTKHAVAATASEYLIYTLMSAAFAVAGLTYLLINFELSRPASVAAKALICTMGAFLLVALGAIVFRIYLIGALIRGASRLPWMGKHVRLKENDVRDTEDLLFVVLRDRPLRSLLIVAIEFAAQALLVLELFVLLKTTGKPFSILHPFLIEAATKFIGLAFFFIPGQVGAAEGAYSFIFKTVGLPASAGFALAVARRLRSLLVAGVGVALAPLWRGTPAGGQELE